MNPPFAEKRPVSLTIHGDTRTDDYYWMNERENPAVKAYLDAENAYREQVMKGSAEFQEKIFNEIVGRIKQEDQSVPYRKNGYYYYSRYEEGREYPVYCRKKGSLDAQEEIMLDVNAMAEGYDYYNVAGLSVSPDNRFLSYGEDTLSRRIYTLRIKDLETGNVLHDRILHTTGSSTWANDNKTLYYERKDEVTLRSESVCVHSVGSASEEDPVIFHEEDETFNTFVYKTKSEKFIVIGSESTLTSEYRVLESDRPGGAFRIIQPRERGHEYSIAHYGNTFYILTNQDARNFRLMQTPASRTSKENWKEVIAHRDDVLLESIDIFSNYLVISERKEGLNHIRIIDQAGNKEHYIEFREEVYDAATSVNPEFDTDLLRYTYTSLTTPVQTYDYNMKTGERILLKQQEVIGDFDPASYESKRIYATASDGTKIPMSLVYRKDLRMNLQRPALIYGYGSYGITMDPVFSSVRLSLLDRGFIYAIAHIRGGQVNGRAWYEDGKLFKKINTFTDFISCSEALVEQGYTKPDRLYAMGGSAGGLLMGAVINMRPDLYRGVVAAVPFVDVVTTMLDESIPLTTGEYDEWGNPGIKEYYTYMLSYSPYDQVKRQDYPNLLVTTGFYDSQVQYWEPAKWVARLREKKTDNNLLLMYCNMETGHSGASGRFEKYRETAMEYAFIFMLEGITE